MASNTTLPPLQKGISDKTHMKRHQRSQPHDHASVETDIDIPPKKEYAEPSLVMGPGVKRLADLRSLPLFQHLSDEEILNHLTQQVLIMAKPEVSQPPATSPTVSPQM